MDFDKNNRDSFWPSYVDIMTTLFAIMLVLFAVSFARFKSKEHELGSIVKEYKDIIDIYSTVDSIDRSGYYVYDSVYLKHTLTVSVAYQEKEYNILNKLQYDLFDKEKADAKRDSIRQAGLLVQETIKRLEQESSKNIKFLVVIEGQSSKIPFNDNDWQNNETLSYLRARFLKKYWTDPISEGGCGLFQHTSENDPNSKCEIIVSGSGEGGVPRFYYRGGENPVTQNPNEENKNLSVADIPVWRDVEQRNQRFLINIIPIIGNIDVTKAKIENIGK